jgi:hypothetical protein
MKLASIETITDISPHGNADSLEIAKVFGWQVIVRKGEFKAGESAVFIPIDTILPDAPWSAFLKKGDKPIRLNTINNLSLKESDTNGFWRAAKKLTLTPDMNFVIQGELMGPGVQGNQMGLMEPTLYVYQIRSLDANAWFSYGVMGTICNSELNCEYVPLVGKIKSGAPIESLQRLADDQTVNGKPAEGIVVRSSLMGACMGNGRPLGFKIINRNYKDQ